MDNNGRYSTAISTSTSTSRELSYDYGRISSHSLINQEEELDSSNLKTSYCVVFSSDFSKCEYFLSYKDINIIQKINNVRKDEVHQEKDDKNDGDVDDDIGLILIGWLEESIPDSLVKTIESWRDTVVSEDTM